MSNVINQMKIEGINVIVLNDDMPKESLNNSYEWSIDSEFAGGFFKRDKLATTQCYDNKNTCYIIYHSNYENAVNLKFLLSNEKYIKYLHAARFDCTSYLEYLKIEVKNYHCTKVASKIARTFTDSHGLDTLINHLTNGSTDKTIRSKINYIDKNVFLSSDAYAAISYAFKDVLYLKEIFIKLKEMLRILNRSFLYDKSIMAMDALISLKQELFNPINVFYLDVDHLRNKEF